MYKELRDSQYYIINSNSTSTTLVDYPYQELMGEVKGLDRGLRILPIVAVVPISSLGLWMWFHTSLYITIF